MTESRIVITLDGSGRAIAQVEKLDQSLKRAGKSANKLASGSSGAAGTVAERTERESRRRVGVGVRAASRVFSPLGQAADAVGAPTAGLAALGVAGVAAGIAVRQFAAIIAESTRVIETEVKAGYAARATIRDAGTNATRAALAFALSKRDEVMAGHGGTKEQRAFYRETDRIQAAMDKAQMDRALRFGVVEMRGQLGAIRNPEAAAALQLSKDAAEQTDIQREILARMNGLEFFVMMVKNGLSGKSAFADLNDAMRGEAAVAAAMGGN